MHNQMIPLTVANTLDQSQKHRVEVPQNVSLKEAIKQLNLAPKGQYDIYDAMGSVISNNQASNHVDSTIYVGVAKVAGGAGIQFDEDWDEGIELDDIPVKQSHLTLILQDGSRHNINPQPGETVMQVVHRAGLRPRDGSPLEVRDNNQEIVSNLLAGDMIGRSFYVVPQRIAGGGRRQNHSIDYPAIVPFEIVEQTKAFTQPRGKLEMGGLLIGHVDHEGNNVVVCGFFPKQTEASSGYCEFDGGALSMAMSACEIANSRCGGPHTPDIQIIGWIHTHPDIGIFLSGIDVDTFSNLRANRLDRRIVAVVVDPLRDEHGVFVSEKSSTKSDAKLANGEVRLSEDLEARYNKFLNRMRYFQQVKGKGELPFIMPGVLYQKRKILGDEDDITEARFQTLEIVNRNLEKLTAETIPNIQRNLVVVNDKLSNLDKKHNSTSSKLIKDINNESVARGTLQVQISTKIRSLRADINKKLKQELKERKSLQSTVERLSLSVDKLLSVNEKLAMENERLTKQILSRPVKVGLRLHSKEDTLTDLKLLKNAASSTI